MHYLAQPDFAVFFYKDDSWGGTGWVKARLSTPRIGACCPAHIVFCLSVFIRVHPWPNLLSSVLESRRTLPRHIERALESQSRAGYRALIEQAADQRNPMGHASRRGESGQRIPRIRRPIAARLANLDEARPERERRMSREIADGWHFVAQRRPQQRTDR